MKIAIRCAHCRQISMQGEDDLMLEFDFYEQKITFICQSCKKPNEFNLQNWKKQQTHSPLPLIGILA